MVMVLRELEIPARLVSGYLPGQSAADGHYDVPQQALHAWVEVYFPGVGWVRFDPTPGDQLRRFAQLPTDLAEGEPVASPGPAGSGPPAEGTAAADALQEPSASPTLASPALLGSGSADAGSTLLLAVGMTGLVILVMTALLLVRLRRLPGGSDDLAYGRIAGLATRLGYGPHPSQTELEYAASLSDTLPSVRHELYLVAHARVEKRYGLRDVAGERRAALRHAYARIRTALLRLGWRAGRHQ
jgi:hypothetical protein